MAVGERIVAEGGRVAVLDMDGPLVGEAAARLGGSGGTAVGVEADVTDAESLENGFREAEAKIGPCTAW